VLREILDSDKDTVHRLRAIGFCTSGSLAKTVTSKPSGSSKDAAASGILVNCGTSLRESAIPSSRTNFSGSEGFCLKG